MKYGGYTLIMPEFTVEQAAAKLRELGYDGMELRVAEIPKKEEAPSFWTRNLGTVDIGSIKEKAESLRKIAESRGLEICRLATYLQIHELDAIDEVMQSAKMMGCTHIRLMPPRYERTLNYHDLLKTSQENLKRVEEIAARHEVKVTFELHHGFIIPSASSAYRLVSPFDSRYIAITFDPGNMIFEGYENWRMGMQILGGYLAYVHVKNGRWVIDRKDEDGVVHWKTQWCRLKEGIIDWKEVIRDLKSVGYDGYLTFEDFSDVPTEEKLAEDIAYLKSLEEVDSS